MKKDKTSVQSYRERCMKLEEALSKLVDRYVANIGTDHEFISCITPKSASQMSFLERKNDDVWSLFDNARLLLGGEYTDNQKMENDKIDPKIVGIDIGCGTVSPDRVGVHVNHCCVIHGCKYGDSDCPVKNGNIPQMYLCESCTNDGIESLFELLSMENIGIRKCPDCGHYYKRDDTDA